MPDGWTLDFMTKESDVEGTQWRGGEMLRLGVSLAGVSEGYILPPAGAGDKKSGGLAATWFFHDLRTG